MSAWPLFPQMSAWPLFPDPYSRAICDTSRRDNGEIRDLACIRLSGKFKYPAFLLKKYILVFFRVFGAFRLPVRVRTQTGGSIPSFPRSSSHNAAIHTGLAATPYSCRLTRFPQILIERGKWGQVSVWHLWLLLQFLKFIFQKNRFSAIPPSHHMIKELLQIQCVCCVP